MTNGYVRWPVLAGVLLGLVAAFLGAHAWMLDSHTRQPHENSVRQATYHRDMGEIKTDIRAINEKLDALIIRAQ